MKKADIATIVIECLNEIIIEMDDIDPSQIPPLDESTRLIGKRSILSSIKLVSLIVDIEQRLEDDYATTVTIADERAMSQEKSPFLTVGTLSEYITLLIKEQTQ